MNGCFFSFFCKSFDCSSLYILQVWLIEVNINPAMQTNCDTLKQILPGLIEETLGKSMTDILSLVQSGYLRLSGNWTDIVQLFPYILDSHYQAWLYRTFCQTYSQPLACMYLNVKSWFIHYKMKSPLNLGGLCTIEIHHCHDQ